jgi:hypothetical protein
MGPWQCSPRKQDEARARASDGTRMEFADTMSKNSRQGAVGDVVAILWQQLGTKLPTG